MSQVSKRYLSQDVYRRIFEIFINSLISIKNKERCEKFINDLLSDTEKIMLAKRLSIAFLLIKKYQYEQISDMLKVSNCTIWQVKRWMGKKGDGYKTILNELIKNEPPTSGILDLLEEIFAPPRRTNWTGVRKKQWEERRKREKPF